METTITDSYAGFWARTAAYFIDGAILAFLVLHSNWLMREQLTDFLDSHPDLLKSIESHFTLTGSADYELKYLIIGTIMYYYLVFMGFLISWMYFAGMESSPLRATVGKWILGIYVTDSNGNRISFTKATGRFFGKMVSGALFGIGYIMAGVTERKQGLHDMMADCLVWRK
jgi:uncharacterized RDD family membrane protein YckC